MRIRHATILWGLTLCIVLLSALDLSAQFRRKNLDDTSIFSPADRHRLRELIIQWITTHPINNPLNPVQQHLNVIGPLPPAGNGVHCKTKTFLTWHRTYIEQLEAWLMGQQDGPKFVPLPKWRPTTQIPNEFFNALVPPGTAVAYTTGGNNPSWLLGEQDPNSLGGYNFSRFENPATICNYFSGNEIRWCMGTVSTFTSFGDAFDNFAADVEWEHDGVHVNISGVMGIGQSPAAAIFWPWHSYVDDLYQYYLCNCTGNYPQKDLYIKDNDADIGDQPNNTTGVFYLSPEIWVRQDQDVSTGAGHYSLENDLNRHENAEYKTSGDNYVYVRVRNKGCQTTTATDVRLRVYWSKAQTAGWSWPGDWTNTPPQVPKRGDEITNPSIPLYVPSLAPGESWVAEVPWQAPNPADYPNDSYHFCLVARLVSTVDPMTPAGEGTDIGVNAWNQNNVAWKNVSVLDIDPLNIVAPGELPWNTLKVRALGNRPIADTRLQFDFPENHGVNAVVELRDELYQIWAAGGYKGEGITRVEGTKEVRVDRPGAYIGGLTLVPRAIYTMAVKPYVEYGREYDGVILNYGERVNFNVAHYEARADGTGHRLVGGNNYEIRLKQSDATNCGELIGEVEMVRPSCPNASDGHIRLHLNSDVSAEYFWSNGGRGSEIANLAPGNYWVVVRTAKNCVERREFVLEDESGLATVMTGTAPRCQAENGEASVEASGGHPPYAYQWYRDEKPIEGATDSYLTGVGFGTYSVLVTDAAGCQVTGQVVFGDDFMNFRLAAQVTDASSEDDPDGAIDLTPVDGMGPFTYTWSNGATTEDLEKVPPGDYSVVVVDHMGCVANATFTVGVTGSRSVQSVDSPTPDLTVTSVVPNPANDLAEVQYTLRRASSVRVEIYDELGKLVSVYDQGAKAAGANSAWLQTSLLPPGRYSCRLVYSGGVSAVPFIVVR